MSPHCEVGRSSIPGLGYLFYCEDIRNLQQYIIRTYREICVIISRYPLATWLRERVLKKFLIFKKTFLDMFSRWFFARTYQEIIKKFLATFSRCFFARTYREIIKKFSRRSRYVFVARNLSRMSRELSNFSRMSRKPRENHFS